MALMTVKEIAKVLKVSPKTVYNWVETGQIPYLKVNGAVRFSKKRLREWLRGKMHGSGIIKAAKLEARKGGKQ